MRGSSRRLHMRSFVKIARLHVLVLAAILSQNIAVSSSDKQFLRHDPHDRAPFDAVPLLILSGGGHALGGIALTRP